MWLITDPTAEAGALETLPPLPGARVLSREALLRDPAVRFGPADRLCVTSEAVLDAVLGRLDDPDRRRAVVTLKDKLAFRRLLAPLYPELDFRAVPLAELPALAIERGRKYVVKPVKGCFGSGVRVVDAASDLRAVADGARREIERNAAVLSGSVLSADEFLVEAFVEGEEYAVDMFYDAAGRPVILNILHHPIPANPAYLHTLYYTSRAVFRELLEPVRELMARANALLGARSLPVHAELRRHGGRLVPIEFNPLRFGGMGVANLSYHTLGVGAYDCFARDAEPDWERLWASHGETAYGFVIAYNGRDVDVARREPDRDRFRRRFTRVVLEVPFDHRTQLAFGILYVAEPSRERMLAVLDTEFNDYFLPARR